LTLFVPQELTSVMSFASSSGGALLGSPSLSRRSSQQLEAKVDMVYSLLAMLSGQEHADMGETLLALSTNPESCLAMRQSWCIPLLVQMVQSDREPDARRKAASALHNLVHSQPDEKLRKREVRVFKLLEHARAYTEALRNNKEFELEVTSSASEDDDRHPVQTVAHLMKLSFDELHRQAICTLGGIYTIANLVEVIWTSNKPGGFVLYFFDPRISVA
jgi:adenomatosis polyposis coli protein